MQLQCAVLYVVENMRPVCVREICFPQLIGNECQPSQDRHLLHTETSSGQYFIFYMLLLQLISKGLNLVIYCIGKFLKIKIRPLQRP
jgi:hypothetical protein